MTIARLGFEFLRPVPLEPLSLATSIVRPGRRVQLLEATLTAGETVVCRASALRIRSAPGTVGSAPAAPPAPAPPEQGREFALEVPHGAATFVNAMDMRFVEGRFDQPGPATVWMRLRRPLVAGQPTPPVALAAAVADFGNGVSAELDWDHYVFINPDLTVYLDREPAGDWICLEARTLLDEAGVGLAESALYDARGRLGRAVQSLYVAPR
jgi:hypothetical protein